VFEGIPEVSLEDVGGLRCAKRTLEEKARVEGSGHDPGLVETQDLLRVIEEYRKIKEVVEKIRYGQYL